MYASQITHIFFYKMVYFTKSFIIIKLCVSDGAVEKRFSTALSDTKLQFLEAQFSINLKNRTLIDPCTKLPI